MIEDRLSVNNASLAGYTLYDAIVRIKELGFRAISLLAFDGAYHSQGRLGGFWWDVMGETERASLTESIGSFGHIALHGPFQQIHLIASHPDIRAASAKVVMASFDAAHALGAEVVALHLEGCYGAPWEDERKQWVGTLRQLGEYAAERGVILGIENTNYPAAASGWVDLLRQIDHPAVKATLDTGHVKAFLPPGSHLRPDAPAYYTDQVCALIEALGDLLVHIHVHDIAPQTWRDHRAPGRGIIDFGRLAETLHRVGYKGLFELELEEPDRIQALIQARETLLDAFRRVEGCIPDNAKKQG